MVLKRVEFDYNVSVHGSIVRSPCQMLYGHRPDCLLKLKTILEGDE